ncbi:MAG: hypothetical protein QM296_04185 [Bacillota bacterium]|nr:hypothetical protein [Bacillota bacterium]
MPGKECTKKPILPQNRGRNEKIDHSWPKIALVPQNRGRNAKLVHIPNSNWRCSTAAFSFHSFSQSGGKRIERKQPAVRATHAVMLRKEVYKKVDIAPESGNIGKIAQKMYRKVDIAPESGNIEEFAQEVSAHERRRRPLSLRAASRPSRLAEIQLDRLPCFHRTIAGERELQ